MVFFAGEGGAELSLLRVSVPLSESHLRALNTSLLVFVFFDFSQGDHCADERKSCLSLGAVDV